MNRIITICAAVLMTASMFAQSPEKMSYQAVVRDGSDALVTSTAVGMQISILQSTANGSAVYVETQTPTANANGLVSVEIGAGTVVSGDFSTIDWANGPYFIKTETDPKGGTSYSITGTSQLMSVPYALYAKTSENGITAEQTTAIETNTAKVGYTEALVSANTAVEANTAKTGITTAQAEAIVDNTVKEGVKNGTTAGEMQYWNGTDWVSVEPGKDGQMLSYSQGVPTWKTVAGNTDIMSSTGQIWMDRNLGASQVATSSTDYLAYGDLYQWGRGADGHQTIVWTSANGSDGSEQTNEINTTSNSTTPGTAFIIGTYNWYTGSNPDDLWKEDGTGVNNPCPSGYRVPTEAEWNTELQSWGSQKNAAGAYASPLKLPMAGYRVEGSGSLFEVGTSGDYWSSTVSTSASRSLNFVGSNANMNTYRRADGYSVRCIKE